MSKAGKASIDVQGTSVTVLIQSSNDFISLTDIAKHKEPGTPVAWKSATITEELKL